MRTFLLSLFLLSNTNFSYYLDGSTNYVTNKVNTVTVEAKKDHKIVSKSILNTKIRKRESASNWTIVNNSGYIGLYQFGEAALQATGYGHVTVEKFKQDPNIWPPSEQEKAMNKLLKINRRVLNKYIQEYKGDTIKGIVITESGLLAAAHLAGAGNAKKKTGVIGFLVTNGASDPHDRNGTKLSDYLSEFANL